jgi:predicted RecA/RadA family phage recombinase
MRNKVQSGNVISVIAPALVLGGQGVLVGALFGVAAGDALQGTPVEIAREGVFDLAANGADTAAQGAKAYWDNTARRITATAASNTLVGAFATAKTASDGTARVLLDGVVR